MKRRSMLTTVSSIAIAPLAGCQEKIEPSVTEPSDRTEYRLGLLSVLNVDATAHSIRLVVLRDDDIVYWETIDLESDSEWTTTGEEFDIQNGAEEPATWEIFAKHTNQTDGVTFRSGEMVGTDGCIAPIVTVHEGGEIGLGMDVSGDGCPGATTEESNNQ